MAKKQEIVVMKFGGTSVGDTESIKKVAAYIKKAAGKKRVVAVVSAMGNTTDKIIKRMKKINPDPPQRELDQLLHIGEIESAALLASALEAIDCPAISMTGHQMEIMADGEHGSGRIFDISGTDNMKILLKEGKVLVCAGFQGIGFGGVIITLGRGGSDTTAVALAYVLEAESCEIYTDVDGVFAVDPRLIANPIHFDFLTYGEMVRMSMAGAGVLMDRSVMLAQRLNIPLRVMLSPSKGRTAGGTLVSARSPDDLFIEDIKQLGKTALAVRKHVTTLTMDAVTNEPGVASEIFAAIKHLVLGDAIQVMGEKTTSIVISVSEEDTIAAEKALKEWSPRVVTECACLMLMNSEMKEDMGYFAKLTEALAVADINIEAMASSGTDILLFIAESELEHAANNIAVAFDLYADVRREEEENIFDLYADVHREEEEEDD